MPLTLYSRWIKTVTERKHPTLKGLRIMWICKSEFVFVSRYNVKNILVCAWLRTDLLSAAIFHTSIAEWKPEWHPHPHPVWKDLFSFFLFFYRVFKSYFKFGFFLMQWQQTRVRSLKEVENSARSKDFNW